MSEKAGKSSVKLGVDIVAPTLVALYLRGISRPMTLVRHRWCGVDALLRAQAPPPGAIPTVLRRAGFEAEALVLEGPGVWDQAAELIAEGSVATPYHDAYPVRWLDALGPAAPPAVWLRRGNRARRWIAVVGSRRVSGADRAFAAAVARSVVACGFGVVSGGAAGCDRAALDAVLAHAMEVLPCGLALRAPSKVAQCSVCAPDEPFSTATAMERNALVYAAGEAAVVVRAQRQQGGTWHGAVDALRRRLTVVGVWADPPSAGADALVALGAVPLAGPVEWSRLLGVPPRGLFDPP